MSFRIFALFFFAVLITSGAHAAQETPQSFTLDGKLYSDTSTGTPLVGTGSLKIQIVDSLQTCVLYEETQNYDTTLTDGAFNIQVGEKTTPVAKRSGGDSGHALADVFLNDGALLTGTLVSNGNPCTGSAASGSLRYVRITVTPTSGSPRVLSPNLPLSSIPSALVAENAQALSGKTASQFVNINTTAPAALSQSNLENIFSTTNYTKLTDLLSGNSSAYVKAMTNNSIQVPSSGSTPSIPQPGQIWYEGGALKFWNGSAPQTLGVSGAGLTSLAGQTGNTQTFASGAAGTAPAITSTSDIHTLNVPLASVAGVTSGTISKTEYDTFNAKLGTATSFVGDVSGTYNNTSVDKIKGFAVSATAPTSSQILVYNGATYAPASLSGDISIGTTGVATLKNTGSVGTYYKVTTDAQGRVVSGATGLGTTEIPDLPWSKINTTPTTLTGYGITDAVLNAGSAPSIQSGTDAAKPSSGWTAGRLYIAGDTKKIYRDDGTAWVEMAPASAGGVTNIATGTGLTGGPIASTGTISLDTATQNGLWTGNGTNVWRAGGSVGIGTAVPRASLDLAAKTDSLALPSGTMLERPSSPVNGFTRYNTDMKGIEAYVNGGWQQIASGVSPTASEDGMSLRWNDTAKQFQWFTAGAAGAGIGTLNGLTNTSQNFAIGTGWASPHFDSATSTHTLHIPMAATGGVTAGLISKTEFDGFNSKLGTGTTFAGDVSGTYNNTSVDKIKGKTVSAAPTLAGQVLRYDGTNLVPTFISMFDLRSTVTGSAAFGGVGCLNNQTLTWTAATDNLACSNISLPAGQLTGVLPVANGGTGTNSLPATFVLNGGQNGAVVAGTNDSNDLTLKTNGSPRLTILSGGNVGVGTSAPGYSLHVVGDVLIDGPLYTGNIPYPRRISGGAGGANQWIRMAKVDLGQQYHFYAGLFSVVGAGVNMPHGIRAEVYLKIKQNDPMGNDPEVDVQLDSSSPSLTYNDVAAVVTAKTGSVTTVELYLRMLGAWEYLAYTPPSYEGAYWLNANSVDYNAAGPFASLPVGTATVAVAGVNPWIKSNSTAIHYSGNVGIGTAVPRASLDLAAKTDSLALPSGTTLERPSSPVNGFTRYNTDMKGVEAYVNGGWQQIASGVSPTASEDGMSLRWNDTAKQFQWFTAGAAGSGIGTLNGLTASSQNFAIGTGWASPHFDSATSTHTLHIPMANTAAVTAGLISKTEFDSFNSKLGTSTSFSGDVSGAYNATSVDKIKGKAVTTPTTSGQMMVYDGTGITPVVMSGDATMLATGAMTLKNTGSVGTYYKVTTDAQGRVVSGATGLGTTEIPDLPWSKINTTPTTLAGYGITDAVRNAGDTPSIQSGTDASKPSSGWTAGRLYFAADTQKIYRDSGVAWVEMAPSAGGSGTPGGSDTQIQFNSGGAFAGSSDFIFDNATKRVGIGTATPQGRLHLEETSSLASGQSYGFYGSLIAAPPAASTALYYGFGGGVTASGTTTSSAALMGGAFVAHSPTAAVVAGLNGVYGIASNSAGTAGEAIGVRAETIAAGTGTITKASGLKVDVRTNGSGVITTGYGLFIEGVEATTSYSIYAKDATAQSYFAGNVGIGTTNANAKLTLQGALSFGQLASDPAGTASYGSVYVKNDGKLYYRNGTGTITDLTAAGSSPSILAVGVGTNGAPSMSFAGDADTGFYNTSSNNTISVGVGGVKIFDFSSSGIASPTAGGASVGTGIGTTGAPTFSFAGDTDTGWWHPGADLLAASTAGAERMRINASGNVGIGTAGPAHKLDVAGTINATEFRIGGVVLASGIQGQVMTNATAGAACPTVGALGKDASGNLYVCDESPSVLIGSDCSNLGPGAVTFDAGGSMYVCAAE